MQFITRHNATDVASFEGACNWHDDCRNVHLSCCPWIKCAFLYHKPTPKAFQRIWQYIQPVSQPQTTCNHTSPGPLHTASSPPRSSETSHPDSLHNQRIYAQTVRNSCLREAHPHAHRPHRGLDLTAVRRRNRLEWANAHIRWRLALWRGVLFTDESRFALYRADGRQRVWHHVGERFADVNIVDRVAHGVVGGYGMGRRMLWTTNTGVFYWWHFECTEISWRDPETHCCDIHPRHHLMLQHNNAWPHVARICTQFLEAENIPVLTWPAYSPDMSTIEHVWDALDWRIRQRVLVPANIQQLRTAIEEEWTSIPQAQSTIWSTLCEGDALHCLRQMVVMVSDPLGPPQYSKTAHLEWSFIVASLRHTCAIIMLSNLHFDMPHLWGGWIITNTDLDRFVNNIWEK